MIELLVLGLFCFLAGLYLGNKPFRKQVNKGLATIFKTLKRIEIKTEKPKDKEDQNHTKNNIDPRDNCL